MIRFFLFFIFCAVCYNISAQVIPNNPNSFDLDGNKNGSWTILFDSNWNSTNSIDSVEFYRVINYDKGLPKGKVYDYYISGKKQWEGFLLSDYPSEIQDGTGIYYNIDSSVSQLLNFKNGELDGLSFHNDITGTKLLELVFTEGHFTSINYSNISKDNFDNFLEIIDNYSFEISTSICESILKKDFFLKYPVLKSILLNVISENHYYLLDYNLSKKYQISSFNSLSKNMKIERGLYIDNLFGAHSLKTPYSESDFHHGELLTKFDTIKSIDKYLVLNNNILSNYIHSERYLNENFGDEKDFDFDKIKKYIAAKSFSMSNNLYGIFNDSEKHKLIEIAHLQRLSLYFSMFRDPSGIKYAQQAFDIVQNEYTPSDFTYILSEFNLGKAYFLNYYYDDASKYFTSIAEKLINNIDLYSNTLPNNLIDELYTVALDVFNNLFSSEGYNAYAYDLYSFINSRELRRKKVLDKHYNNNSNLDHKLLSDSLIAIYKNISKCYELTKIQQVDYGLDLEKLILDSRKLETKINQNFGDLSMLKYDIDDITSRLNKDEVFVDIIKVDVDFSKITPQEKPHYFAYIFLSDSLNNDYLNNKKANNYYTYYRDSDSLNLNPLKGNSSWVMEIDYGSNLDSVYDSYNYYTKKRPNQMLFSSYDKYIGAKLYDSFWYRIIDLLYGNGENGELDMVGDISKIYFSPEGVYSQINPNVLYDSISNSFLIDKYDITFIDDIEDFVHHKENIKSYDPTVFFDAVVVGNPTFLLDDDEVILSSNIRKSRSITELEQDNLQRGMSLSNLPATMIEINQISELLKSNNWNVELISGANANETKIKSLNSPRLLHIATHGFFFEDQQLFNNLSKIPINNEMAVMNPMTRSGLIFSGAQNTVNGEMLANDNGWLNSYEASLLNLKGTELVVLSACDTGMGDIQNGKGVFGLQRAIRLAGAESLIMSMWKVDDKATQELMTHFYDYWIDKKLNKKQAFKKAQGKIREKYKHPYYWGAFILIGE